MTQISLELTEHMLVQVQAAAEASPEGSRSAWIRIAIMERLGRTHPQIAQDGPTEAARGRQA